MSNLISAHNKTGPKPKMRYICSAVGCESIADHPISGLCHMHYARVRRTGAADATRRTRGTGTITTYGYIAISENGKKKQEHVLIVEALIGHELPVGAEVHHIDGNRSNNAHANLVVCPSKAYHKMIHQRQASLDACGNPSHRKCPFCKQYSDPESMTHNKSSRYFYHAACKTAYNQQRKTT